MLARPSLPTAATNQTMILSNSTDSDSVERARTPPPTPATNHTMILTNSTDPDSDEIEDLLVPFLPIVLPMETYEEVDLFTVADSNMTHDVPSANNCEPGNGTKAQKISNKPQ